MRKRLSVTAAALALGMIGLIVPAIAQMQDHAGRPADRDMKRMQDGPRMSHRMMSSGMMEGGCAGMMQSMNGGDGRPNSQWRSGPDNSAKPD